MSRRSRGLRAVLRVLPLTTAVVLAGCGSVQVPSVQNPPAGNTSGQDSGSWQQIPTSPLSPRENAHTVWTGGEVLVIGGSDAPPCPPNARCVPPDLPARVDGAAYAPDTRSWRRIADSPVPIEWADSVLIGRSAYLWITDSGRPGSDRAFLRYDIDADQWHRLPPPPAGSYRIAAAGEQIVGFSPTDELGEYPDAVFDPRSGSWTLLPPDPLSPSFDRSMAWTGKELVLFDHELVPNPGSERPAVVRAAALDLATGSWRRLPDSEILYSDPWVLVDGRLVNPMLGSADGGQVNNWGRSYPNGGILDPSTGSWTPLPAAPADPNAPSAGVRFTGGGYYIGYHGWVFDTTAGNWSELPALDDTDLVTGRSIAAARADLLVFGGTRWAGLDGTLLNDAWLWSAT